MKKFIFFLGILITMWANTAASQDPLTIGIKTSGPFAYKVADEWKGVSVDLIAMLAERLGFTYQFIDADSVPNLLAMSANGITDMSIGAISMTDEREKNLDFSHPYFTTTQGFLVNQKVNYFWFIAKKVLIAGSILLVVCIVFGFLISRANRKDNIKTIGDGAWFSIVSATTTGYGDKVPEGALGRVMATTLMISSMFLMPVFTSHITSALTVEKLSNEITTLADLANTKAVSIKGTTSDLLLNQVGIKHSYVHTLMEGMNKIKDGEAKAFVYDKAMLDYLVKKEDNNSLVVHPINNDRERYAIAFPTNSKLREPVNVEILSIIDSPEWTQLLAQYFGI